MWTHTMGKYWGLTFAKHISWRVIQFVVCNNTSFLLLSNSSFSGVDDKVVFVL